MRSRIQVFLAGVCTVLCFASAPETFLRGSGYLINQSGPLPAYCDSHRVGYCDLLVSYDLHYRDRDGIAVSLPKGFTAILMYFRARYYNSGLGQFISRDPLGYVDGMSQYRAYFVPGGVDPWGLIAGDPWTGPQWHHVIPTSWRENIEEFYAAELEARGIIAQQWLDRADNGWVISGKWHNHIHNKGNDWNTYLNNYIKEWPATLDELQEQAFDAAFAEERYSKYYLKGGRGCDTHGQFQRRLDNYWYTKKWALNQARASTESHKSTSKLLKHLKNAGRVGGFLLLIGVQMKHSAPQTSQLVGARLNVMNFCRLTRHF